jgi:hypothetical protein
MNREVQMSMQALNQLVARSITDPTVAQAFGAGQIGDILSDLGFAPDLRTGLTGLKAETFAEFAVLAYRAVKAVEVPAVRIQLPSPVEGLLPKSGKADEERVA